MISTACCGLRSGAVVLFLSDSRGSVVLLWISCIKNTLSDVFFITKQISSYLILFFHPGLYFLSTCFRCFISLLPLFSLFLSSWHDVDQETLIKAEASQRPRGNRHLYWGRGKACAHLFTLDLTSLKVQRATPAGPVFGLTPDALEANDWCSLERVRLTGILCNS